MTLPALPFAEDLASRIRQIKNIEPAGPRGLM
jgi:hypothetical protein